MTRGFIEINDVGIRHLSNNNPPVISPGYAVLDGNTLLVGKTARENTKRRPGWSNNKYWGQLNTNPIDNGTHNIRHHADLAFAQLEQIKQSFPENIEQILIAVPGFFDRSQLGLLLGIAKEAKLAVSGLVDTALLSVINYATATHLLYLDISLHKICLTSMRQDGSLGIDATQVIAETGLATVWDRWASIIASQFIQASRYDPMHEANSEQKLFDVLPLWISQSQGEPSRTFEFADADITHTAQISSEQLLTACASIYPEIIQAIRHIRQQNSITELFISHHFDGFPHLIETLSLIPNLAVHTVPADACATAAMENWQHLTNTVDAVSLTTSLPMAAKPARQQSCITHLLVGYSAYYIGQQLNILSLAKNRAIIGVSDAGFSIRKFGETVKLFTKNPGVTINQLSVKDSQTIHPGDVIECNAIEARLISAIYTQNQRLP